MKMEDIIRKFIDEAFNKGNLSVLEEVIHPDYRYRSPDSELTGISELRTFIQGFREGFPDLCLSIDDLIVTEDRACTSFKLTGTHKGEFMGIPPSGSSVDVNGIVISRFKEDKIAEDWEILDNLTFLQQIGAFPELT